MLLTLAPLALLSGCDFGTTSGSSYGNPAPTGTTPTGSGAGGGATAGVSQASTGASPSGTHDSVLAVPSVDGTVSVAAGAAMAVSIAFNSSDGLAMSGFAVTGAALPAGWSGPAQFSCASVSTGSGCVLVLTYAPASVGSGSLTLDYVFIDNAMEPQVPGGTVTIPYQATSANNVQANVAPLGQVTAAVGSGNQSVVVNFTTDNGMAATGFSIPADAAMPAGWTDAAAGLTCSVVSTGNGCQLVLNYRPTQAGGGILTLPFAYRDDGGAARSGAVSIPYLATTGGSVTATPSPQGEIDASINAGGQSVAVGFTTDQGAGATDLVVTTDLAQLPPGWSSTSSPFYCTSVAAGGGCQLHLRYAPTSLSGGTLVLAYTYVDAGGTVQAGSASIPYAATTNDNVIATPAPTGQVAAIVGQGARVVSVGFATDDGRPATEIAITSDLGALPPGWTSAAPSFGCPALSSVNGCSLSLSYDPIAAGAGTLSLSYRYLDNALTPKTGSVDIAYVATTDHSVLERPGERRWP